MTEYYLDCDEYYPWYYLSKPSGKECSYFKDTRPLINIPEDKLEWIQKTVEEFEKVQKYIKKLWEEYDDK